MTEANTEAEFRPVIWVLADDRAGNVSQCLGVAEKLKLPYDIKLIEYNQLAKLPNHVLGATLKSLKAKSRAELETPWPDIVIAAGRRTAPIARYIKQESGGNTKLVQLMWPEAGVEEFDLIVVPEHDEVPKGTNMIRSVCSSHRLTKESIEQAATYWKTRLHEQLPRPWFTLLVGGDTRHGAFSSHAARHLGEMVTEFVKPTGGSLLVTTSRRTPPMTQETLLDAVKIPTFVHKWDSEEENPYLGFLGLCDGIIATGDSVSMISEACFTGKPVYLFDKAGNISSKHRRFHEVLYQRNMARPLSGDARFEKASYPIIDLAQDVAFLIRNRFCKKAVFWPA